MVGTARVLDALRAGCHTRVGGKRTSDVEKLLASGERWLLAAQHADGGWGMGNAATVEETALAVIALSGGDARCESAARRGCAWLVGKTGRERERAAPIGLYFSLLWYHERLYPLAWALEALGLNVTKEVEHVG